jgi:hypothetical protein
MYQVYTLYKHQQNNSYKIMSRVIGMYQVYTLYKHQQKKSYKIMSTWYIPITLDIIL